jgi:hypothetical protein
MRLLAGAMAAVLLAGAFSTAGAQINQRQRNQQKRIVRGVRSGELTRGEFRRLEREQFRIGRIEARARRDGELTARERFRLNRQLNQAGRHIYRQKHDRQDRN